MALPNIEATFEIDLMLLEGGPGLSSIPTKRVAGGISTGNFFDIYIL